MVIDEKKMKETMQYIIQQYCSESSLGRTIFSKILYFSDFDFYELYKELITGEEYTKFPQGPIPKHFLKMKDELIEERKIKETKKASFVGADFESYNYTSLTIPKNEYLNQKEKDVINSVIKRVSGMNASQISEYSHGDMQWMVAKDYEIMDYRYVFYRSDDYSVKEYDDI
jgi:hypothetical protein